MLVFSFSFQYLQEKSLVPVNELQFLQENMFIRGSYKRHNMTPASNWIASSPVE